LIQNDSMDEELASWMFIQHLLGAANQAKFAAETLYSPVIKEAYDSDLLMNRGVDYKYEDMMFKVLKSQMNNDMKPNLFSNMNITILDDEVVQYLLGTKDASELYETVEVYNPFLTSGLYLKDEFDLLLDTESILLLDSIVLPDLYLGNSIVWSSSDEDILLPNATVIRSLNGEGDKAVILTATITKDNVVLEKDFYYIVKEQDPDNLSIEEFLYLQDSEKATISGVVTGKIIGKGFHMSDDTGSIYVYLGSEPLVEIGDYIGILGYKKTYYNLDEIVDIESLEIISTGNLLPEFTPTSILDLYETDNQNTNMYSTPILIQGIVEISGEFNNVNISWFDENNTKQFVNVYYKSGSADKLAELETLVGTYVSVEAILQDYYSAGWWRINVNTNSVITELTLTDQEKAQYALSNIDLGDITNVTTNINLPLVGTYDFDIAWESSNALVIDEAGAVFASTVEQDVVLTAKITVNGVVYSRVFNIHVGRQ